MNTIPIGKSKTMVSGIGLGGGNWGREVDENTSYSLMDYAIENGITFFDTGDLYGGGQSFKARQSLYGTDDRRETTLEMYSSEKIIGRWMASRGCRDEITLCTKVGSGGSAENIKKSLERSLDHLGTDHVDIYKLHRYYDDVPISETLAAMSETVTDELTRVIGASNYSAKQVGSALEISRIHGLHKLEVLQLPYSLAAPDIERDLLPMSRRNGIAVTAYSPLAAGFLTGKYVQDPKQWPRGSRYHIMPSHADQYFSKLNFHILELLVEKESKTGIPAVQLALAWAMAHEDITSTLIGARNTAQIENALVAYNHGLDTELWQEMSSWIQ